MTAHLRPGGLSLLAVVLAATLAACRAAAETPQTTQVQPSTAAPGGLVLVSGRGFDRADVVWLDGRPAASVTWVNARLLTAVVPEGLAAGAYPLEVRSLDGRRDAVALNVGPPAASPVAPPAVEAAPRPAPQPPPVPVPASGAAAEAQRKAEERRREEQKKAEARRREDQKKAEERQREADKKREEDEKKRRE